MNDLIMSDLIQAIRTKQCIPFIGAGLSKDSGVLLWSELIEDMKPRLLSLAEEEEGDREEEELYLNQANYLDIATRFKYKVGLGNYYQFLQERFRPPNSTPNNAHRALAKISTWPFVITTNFDKLLEVAFTKPGQLPPAVVTEPEELVTAIRSGEFFILKLHGDIDRAQSIVLTRDEYEQFVQSRRGQLLLDTLRQQLMFRNVLFIGFALNDPNFLRVFGEAGWLTGGYQNSAYSIMAYSMKPEREEWQRRQLRVISLPNYDQLPNLLNTLAEKVIGIGDNIILINSLNKDFESPRSFLLGHPFFQVSTRWPCDFVRELLSTQQSGFSVNYLDSEEIWEPYKTTHKELAKTNHLLVTIDCTEVEEIPEWFWQRMPCNRETLVSYVLHNKKSVFGVHEADGLFTLVVVTYDYSTLGAAISSFINLSSIPPIAPTNS
jgi:hypothetical protein